MATNGMKTSEQIATAAESVIQAGESGSVLDKLNAEFVRDHKGKTPKKRVSELTSAFLKAVSDRTHAEKAVEAAKQAETDAAKAIIREVSGKSKVTIGGNLYSPMSRGDVVFFRKESGAAIDLG